MAAIMAAALVLILIKRKNNKAAGIMGIIALTLIGCGLTIQVSYASMMGSFKVSKMITIDGEEKEVAAIVTYGTKVADVDVTADYDRVLVYAPSIVKDPVTGTYYVFGSDMTWAKSDDLINWETFTNNINRDYETLFADSAEWSKHGSAAYDVAGNLWAPDVIYNEDMGKWCMYMSVNGDYWYTSIALLTADSLDGDWEYKGTVVYSGFTNAAEAAKTDLAKVIGTNEVPARYLENRNGNRTYGMNAIDPCVKYDEDGNLWMTYGSWFGGIYMLRLDNETGLRDYAYTYETVANVSDEYQGLKLAGGAHVSGEASYIEKIGDYWYLFMSYGGSVATGGYNIRVFRSENIAGPYTDVDGNDARYTGYVDNVNGSTGIKIFGNYKWNTMKAGSVAQGQNAILTDDDGKVYIVYQTKFADGTEGSQVRIHQLFTNQDGWLVAAPYEYTGETLSTAGYAKEELAGSYEVLYHRQSVDYANLECVTSQDIVLNADGTVSGDYTGTWECEAGSPYVTMVLGGVEYKGVFIKQYVDETTEQTMCFTLLGNNEVEFWGSKYLTGKIAVDMTIAAGTVNIPESAMSDITFVTEGLYGTTISYSSSDTAVIANDGTVTRGSEDKDVVVTVTYRNGDYTYEKDYTITVIRKDEEIDTSEYAYYQDYSRSDKSEWTSVSAAGAMTIANDKDSRGNYFKLAAGADTGNRGAYAAFKYDDGTNITGKYTVSMDVSLTAGILAQRSVSVFAILGADASGHTANDEVTSGYILKLKNTPPSTSAMNTNDASLQDTWYINDTSTTVKIPVGEWVTITAEVDTAAGSANVTISKADKTELFADTVSINGSGELYGLQMLRGRGIGTMSVDTIAVTIDEAGGDNPDNEEPPTVTANVSGTAYPDKDSNITVTFTGDKELSREYPVKINGTEVSAGTTVDMMTVNSITYSGNECTVSLKMSAINGWHSVTGSYDVELMNGSIALASQNVSYSLDLSSDTDYTVIKPSTNDKVKAYYKFDGTKMYVMTVIKGTIHCDGTEAGGTTYEWWNGACSQLYVTIEGTEYSVGSYVHNSTYANAMLLAMNNNHTPNYDLINNADTSKVTRSYMALGTFDDDADTDTGCILLNVVDFSLAGYTANTLSGKTISFCGFIGPNDNTLRFEAILESETYTIVNGADPIEDDTTPPTVTAQVSGTAYPDKDSNVTVTFTGDKELSSKYPVKINGTTVASGDTLDMIVVDSITYSGNKCTVSLKVSGLKGSQSQKGSYDVEMVSGNTSLAKENISYSMDLSPDTVYTKIKTTAENQYSSAYYKVDGTNMYIMTVIKSDKIHSDSVTVNGISYGWFNCIGAEMFMTLNGTKYNVGSHIYLGQFMNSMAFRGENVILVDDESNSTRVFTALGTFDSDDDVDTGCIMLHILDLTKAGFDESTLSGKDMTFSGYIGPNDYDTNGDGTRFVGIDESQTYTLQ